MIRPTSRAVLLLAAGFPLALLPTVVAPSLWTVWAVAIAITWGVLLAELFRMATRNDVVIESAVPSTVAIGLPESASFQLRHARGREVAVTLRAEFDAEFVAPEDLAQTVTSTPREVRVPLVPRRRGTYNARALWLRWRSPWGLLERTVRHKLDAEVAVVPNVKPVRDAALRFFTNPEFMSGLKVERYIGDGSEFESLREFVPGLDHRAIHWAASARHRKLLCRDFRAERNQQIVLAFDSGYLMREPLGGIPRLDHAINAGLLLGYVGLKGGDRVGFFAFDEKVNGFANPQGGVRSMRMLQHRTSELQYTAAETNFTLGLSHLMSNLRRRSLIVLFTDFADTITAELMTDNVQLLARRHVVIFVTLRDPELAGVAETPPDDTESLHRAVLAGGLLRDRGLVHRRLTRVGVHCLDALPGDVSMSLVNRYLEIRRRELV